MKYKITSVIATVFIIASMVLFVYNNVGAVKEKFKGELLSPGLVKNMILYVRDRDAVNVPCKEEYINANSLLMRILDRHYIEDAGYDVAKLKNGYLAFVSHDEAVLDSEKYADSITEFKDRLARNGIDFMYVSTPEKICPNDTHEVLPPNTHSLYPDPIEVVTLARDSGVNVLDLEKCIHEDFQNHYELFFKSDHHWKPETGFYASKKICDKLKNDYGFEFDSSIFDIDNYVIKTYDNFFIGSQGKRTGAIYSPIDDFSLIYPKFDTDLSINTEGTVENGSFYDTVFDMDCFSSDPSEFVNSYAMYLGGDFSNQVIVNNNATNYKKIVLVRDSFSCVTAPFIALTCSELHILDLRHFEDMSALEYSESIGADAVIVMYNPSMFSEAGSFDFLGNETE